MFLSQVSSLKSVKNIRTTFDIKNNKFENLITHIRFKDVEYIKQKIKEMPDLLTKGIVTTYEKRKLSLFPLYQRYELNIFEIACLSGNLSVVNLICEQCNAEQLTYLMKKDNFFVFELAAENGHTDILLKLYTIAINGVSNNNNNNEIMSALDCFSAGNQAIRSALWHKQGNVIMQLSNLLEKNYSENREWIQTMKESIERESQNLGIVLYSEQLNSPCTIL